MLSIVDLKVFGSISIIILLILGYFVYLLYQEFSFVKKEFLELKMSIYSNNHIGHEDYENDYDGDDEEELSDEQQDEELERHLASFMEQRDIHPVLEEIVEEPEEPKEEKKKVVRRKKKEEVQEVQENEE